MLLPPHDVYVLYATLNNEIATRPTTPNMAKSTQITNPGNIAFSALSSHRELTACTMLQTKSHITEDIIPININHVNALVPVVNSSFIIPSFRETLANKAAWSMGSTAK